jgi:hypothetical protein
MAKTNQSHKTGEHKLNLKMLSFAARYDKEIHRLLARDAICSHNKTSRGR